MPTLSKPTSAVGHRRWTNKVIKCHGCLWRKCFIVRKFYRRLNIKYSSLGARCRLKSRQLCAWSQPHVSQGQKARYRVHRGNSCTLYAELFHIHTHLSLQCLPSIYRWTYRFCSFICKVDFISSREISVVWENSDVSTTFVRLTRFSVPRSKPTLHEPSLLWTRQLSWSV